jgi:DNA-binding transcriptional MerR regulator
VDSLMPIGRFSRASRLSVKALRLYDAEGLLVPAWVDPASGYRHYRPDQIRRAEAICVLRMVDMPLARVREVLDLDSPEAVRAALAEHRALLAGRLDEQERMLRFLERLMNREDIAMPYDITIKTIEAQRVVGHRVHTSLENIGQAVGEAFGGALGAIASAGAIPAGIPFVVYHDIIDDQTDGEVEACIPVAPGAADGVAVDIPAAEVVATLHRGPYMEIGPAYEALGAWLAEQGREPVGPPREVYLNDPNETAPEELLTEVQFPLSWK